MTLNSYSCSVVTVAGICNSVGGGAGGCGKYRSVSRLGLLIGNRWKSRLVVLEWSTYCSLHATVEGALSTVTAVCC